MLNVPPVMLVTPVYVLEELVSVSEPPETVNPVVFVPDPSTS
jgi:hypothetical protein